MFVGIQVRSTAQCALAGADNIRFWYPDTPSPLSEWYRQWVAAGGGLDVSQAQGLAAIKTMANPRPDALIVANYQADTANSIQLYGVDIHDVGELGVHLSGNDHSIVGSRIWNIDEGTYDPGYGVPGGDGSQGNTIQTDGGVYRAVVQDSYLNGKVQWAAVGNTLDSQFDDLWMAGSQNAGILVDASSGQSVTGHLNAIRAFRESLPVPPRRQQGPTEQGVAGVHYPALTTSGVDTTAPSGAVDGNGQLDPVRGARRSG